jgi:hypothetical protein
MDLGQSIEMLRREGVDTSSDETSQLMVVADSIIHEHNRRQIPLYQDSTKGRLANLKRYKDYFHLTNPVYKKVMFPRRYRMSRDLFLIILGGVRDYDPYFHRMAHTTGK